MFKKINFPENISSLIYSYYFVYITYCKTVFFTEKDFIYYDIMIV